MAVLWNGRSSHWQVAEAAARARGWKLLSVVLRDTAGLEAAFNAATSAGAGTILVLAAALIFQQAGRVAELAARARLPAMYELRAYVEAGGLVSYGPDIVDVWRRAAVFVDKILKGARPADLPIEQPSVFELIVNLGTARALGLTVPPALLLRADEVIS